jgi:hypothetical protein
MDQRSICLFLVIKGFSDRAVCNELTAVLGADAIAYLTATKYLHQRQFTSILVGAPRPDEPATIVIDQAVLDALERYPFSSIRELARLTCIPTTTVHRHLTQPLGFVVKHLRWVAHTLTPTQKPNPLRNRRGKHVWEQKMRIRISQGNYLQHLPGVSFAHFP